MNEQMILDELLAFMEANGVTVRNEPLGGSGGGFCVIKDQRIFFVDTQAAPGTMAVVCAEALPKVMDIEQVYMKPEVRQFIEDHGSLERQ